jgi:hypothetical protein
MLRPGLKCLWSVLPFTEIKLGQKFLRHSLVKILRDQTSSVDQGCQMVYFRTKKINKLGKFWRALKLKKMLEKFMTTWYM